MIKKDKPDQKEEEENGKICCDQWAGAVCELIKDKGKSDKKIKKSVVTSGQVQCVSW